MKTALVIVEIPKTSNATDDKAKWTEFLERIRRIGEPPTDTTRLTENVWQIRLDNALPFLAKMIPFLDENKISMRLLLLDEPPAWITHPPAS